MAGMTRRMLSIMTTSFQVWETRWSSSSPWPFIAAEAKVDKIDGSRSVLAFSSLDGSQSCSADLSAWEVVTNSKACFISPLPFYGFMGWGGCGNMNCIWECHEGTECSGHIVTFRNIILKQKHILVLCMLILVAVSLWEISVAEMFGARLPYEHSNCYLAIHPVAEIRIPEGKQHASSTAF